MKWLEQFKRAIIEDKSKDIHNLLNNIPEFKKIEDMRLAYTLIGQAKEKFEKQQINMQDKMNKMQKAKNFLQSAQTESKFDEVY